MCWVLKECLGRRHSFERGRLKTRLKPAARRFRRAATGRSSRRPSWAQWASVASRKAPRSIYGLHEPIAQAGVVALRVQGAGYTLARMV